MAKDKKDIETPVETVVSTEEKTETRADEKAEPIKTAVPKFRGVRGGVR